MVKKILLFSWCLLVLEMKASFTEMQTLNEGRAGFDLSLMMTKDEGELR